MSSYSGTTEVEVRGVLEKGHPAISDDPGIRPREAFKRILGLAEETIRVRRKVAAFLTEDHPLAANAGDMSLQEILIYLIAYTQNGKPQMQNIQEPYVVRTAPTVAAIAIPLSTSAVLNEQTADPDGMDISDDDFELFTAMPAMST